MWESPEWARHSRRILQKRVAFATLFEARALQTLTKHVGAKRDRQTGSKCQCLARPRVHRKIPRPFRARVALSFLSRAGNSACKSSKKRNRNKKPVLQRFLHCRLVK
ncbi:unnamed protein product [Effrenium voratum]|uniref:Uncharacterized protein n=1 Tax=Effrenium voratum TaxID=2562239 RepID=A0AA36MYI5_9DINO|nr:unnamed protein product [Effrenium voratum]